MDDGKMNIKKNRLVLLLCLLFLAISGFVGCSGDNKDEDPTDTTPNIFSFSAQTGVGKSTVVTSNTITVSGINAPSDISISGADGMYSINGGNFTNSNGVVNNGDTVKVQVTSSASAVSAVSVILTIGDVSGSFNVTTEPEDSPTDTIPDAFTFTSQDAVAFNTVVTSNPITITGINAPTSISISGADGSYSINGGVFTNTAGTVNKDDTITVRVTSSSTYSTVVTTILDIGGVQGAFNTITSSADTAPESFTFNIQTGVTINTVVTSNAITVDGVNSPTAISITGGNGAYSINGGAYTHSAGTVTSGDTVTVRLTSSSNYNEGVTTTLSIGGVNGSFNVVTQAGGVVTDTTPDAFVFTAQTNVLPSTVVASNTITVSGIDDATTISISGADGAYSINGGAYTQSVGTVNGGDTVTVRLTSSSSYSTVISTTLMIGGITDAFNVTTQANPPTVDTIPNPFEFTIQTDAHINTMATSNQITVSGINAASPISISGAGGMYSINGGAYTGSAGTVNSGDTLTVRLTSSSSYSTPVSTTLTIGGITGTFNVTTEAYVPPVDTAPDAFVLIDQTGVTRSTTVISDAIIVSGINAGAPISISGADGMYSINGGAYTNSEGTVNSGDTIRVRLTSSSNFNTVVTATLNIGGVTGSFNVITEATDQTPDDFLFNPQTDVALNTVVTSNQITVSGLNDTATISITGADGTYSVNGGAYTDETGQVENGDTVTVRVTSSSSGNTETITSLTVGTVSESFKVTTVADISKRTSIIAAGYAHTVVISDEGILYGWGNDNWGQLGNNSTADSISTPTPIGSDTDWIAVGAGGSYTCAINESGALYAWGKNSYGNLGDGTRTTRYAPTRIGSDSDWASVSVGFEYTLAIKKDGSLYAWGAGGPKLGIGNDARDQLSPVQVGTDSDWIFVSAGSYSTFAIKSDGSLYAWGRNTNGQLGIGNTDSKNIPTRVGTDTGWSAISTGEYYTVGIKNGALYAWGSNIYGELGDGTTINRYTPTRIGTDQNWASVSKSIFSKFVIALKKDGTIYGWGENFYGVMGNGTLDDIATPTQIGTDSDWLEVDTGTNFVIALKTDGSLYGWGKNTLDQLGLGDDASGTIRYPTKIIY